MEKVTKTLSIFIIFILIFIANTILLIYLYQYNQKLIIQKQILADLSLLEVKQKQYYSNSSPFVNNAIESQVNVSDARVAVLKSYLRKMNSPLFYHADKIVEYSDQNNLDYRLLVAIAGQESTFCQKIPPNSNNCWGWGIYGDNVIYFSSYEDGIKTVAEGLKKQYVDKGLITTEQIMNVYTPSSQGSWAAAIRHFFRQIEKPS